MRPSESPLRPKLLGITMTYELGGQTFQHPVDIQKFVALFWGEDHSVDILGTFYKAKGKKLTLKQAVAGFGPNAERLFKKKAKLLISKKLLRALWDVTKSHAAAAEPETAPPLEGQQEPTVHYALMAAHADFAPVAIGKEPNCAMQGLP